MVTCTNKGDSKHTMNHLHSKNRGIKTDIVNRPDNVKARQRVALMRVRNASLKSWNWIALIFMKIFFMLKQRTTVLHFICISSMLNPFSWLVASEQFFCCSIAILLFSIWTPTQQQNQIDHSSWNLKITCAQFQFDVSILSWYNKPGQGVLFYWIEIAIVQMDNRDWAC